MGASAFYKGYEDQAQFDALEQQRAETLAQLQQNRQIQAHNFGRQVQQENYQDKQRATAEQLLQIAQQKEEETKKKLKVLATNNIDKAILEVGKQNYEPIKKVLLNDTDSNPNKDVKQLLEGELGGKIVDVRKPNPANVAAETDPDMVNSPDTVEIEVMTPSGEKVVRHMSTMQLGIMLGTPNRVGVDEFHKSLDGSQVPKTPPVDLAKQLSITFDGKIAGLKENLALAASVGNDPNAKKLLDIVNETSAKDGESLLKTLTAEYGKAKDPKEKKAILSRIAEVNNLMTILNNKAKKQDTDLSKSKLQGKLAQAVLDGDDEKVAEYTKALQAIDAATGKKTKAELDAAKAEKLDKEFTAKNTYENIINGKADSDLAVKKITSGQQWQSKAMATLEADRVLSADKQGERALDLTAPETRTGKVTAKGKRILDYLRKVEEAGHPDMANSQVKKSLDMLKGTTVLTGSMSRTLKLYDTIKQEGLLKGTEKSGLAYMIKEGLKTFIGDPEAGKGVFKSMEKDIDKIHELQSKKSLTRAERTELKRLRSRYLQNAERSLKTENYFNLKKLLQSISGMGVTNKELEGFKQYFGGADYASLDAMTAKLKEATLAQMHIANGEFNTLLTAGLPYTAHKSILDMRHEGEYLINSSPDRDISRGLVYNIQVAHPMENTKVYNHTIDKFSEKVGAPPAKVRTLASKLLTMQMQGVNRLSEIYNRMPDLTNQDKQLIKELIPVLSEVDRIAETNKLYDSDKPSQKDLRR